MRFRNNGKKRWCDRQESNLYCELRKLVSYPLEDGRVGAIVAASGVVCLGNSG